ncbi:hypothetical protein ACLX1H_005899 [Fusarium chlamydosporum]
MAARLTHQKPRLSWLSLPPEIRSMILDRLSTKTDVYARVCQEWRTFFEKRNFSHLKLSPSCLDFLSQLTEDRIVLVDHVWLNIELNRYTCRSCRKDESVTCTLLNNRIIVEAVTRLFSVLAKWDHKRRLTLELNAYSPSDLKHWFKDCYFGGPDEDKYSVVAKSQEIHDPQHGYWHGRIIESPPDRALARPFVPCDSIRFERREELPVVKAVTKFLLRRQCRRQLHPFALAQLWTKLPRLEEIFYEPWQLLEGVSQSPQDRFYEKMITEQLPRSINKITIFEDFNENYLDLFQLFRTEYPLGYPDRIRKASSGLGSAFAARSRDLEHLSVAFLINADHFFGALEPNWR